MDTFHRALLHKTVQEAAQEIDKRGGLPKHESHPYGRIPVAHIYHVLMSVFERPANQLPNNRWDEVLEVIQFCVDHFDEKSIVRQIKHEYKPMPLEVGFNTLEDFT